MWRFALNIYHAPAHVVSAAFPRIRVSGPNNQPWLYLDENAFLALLNELLERFYEHSGSYKLPTLAPIISENLKTITATGSTSFSADSNIFAVCCETDIHLLSFPTAAHTVHHCRLNAHTNHMLNEGDVLEIFFNVLENMTCRLLPSPLRTVTPQCMLRCTGHTQVYTSAALQWGERLKHWRTAGMLSGFSCKVYAWILTCLICECAVDVQYCPITQCPNQVEVVERQRLKLAVYSTASMSVMSTTINNSITSHQKKKVYSVCSGWLYTNCDKIIMKITFRGTITMYFTSTFYSTLYS